MIRKRRYKPLFNAGMATLILVSIPINLSTAASADQPSPPRVGAIDSVQRSYLRVRRAAGTPIAMDTAVARFTTKSNPKASPIIVDLISAVHVADAAYYRRLNELFRKYDVVLYELVALPDTRPEPVESDEGNPLRSIQTGLKEVLDLDYQLDGIDYNAPNFVHADLSPAEVAKAWTDSGDTLLDLISRLISHSSTDTTATAGMEAELVLALLQPEGRGLRLKRILARQFEDLETSMKVIEGPNGSALIGARNQRVVTELQHQIDAGRRHIGIFFGAGHMPDLASKLGALGLERRSTIWLTAWSMAND